VGGRSAPPSPSARAGALWHAHPRSVGLGYRFFGLVGYCAGLQWGRCPWGLVVVRDLRPPAAAAGAALVVGPPFVWLRRQIAALRAAMGSSPRHVPKRR